MARNVKAIMRPDSLSFLLGYPVRADRLVMSALAADYVRAGSETAEVLTENN